MSKIIYNMDLMKYMNFFESVTGTKLKDCFIDKNSLLVFVVQENEIGKAIGKSGSNIKRMEFNLKRKIKIVEFNPEITEFVRGLVMPIRVEGVQLNDGTLFIKGADAKTRGMLIGRESQNLKNFEEIIRRYFDIKQLRVL